jgi:hypothetical protein
MALIVDLFLETQLFCANNFDFDRTAFLELIERVKDDRVNVFLTSITVGEVKRHLSQEVRTAANAIDKMRADIRILANSAKPEVKARAQRLDPKPVIAELLKQFEDFVKETQATLVDASKVNPEVVFQKYFDLQLPFQQKQEKRHEFPDAFAIEALRHHAQSSGHEVVVITGDKGFRGACEAHAITVFESLEEFLNRENTERESKISEHILKCFETNRDEVEQQIKQQFEMSAFILTDQEGEVDSATIEALAIEDPLVVRIEQRKAILDVSVRLEFGAKIIYDDPDSIVYDREEGRTYAFNTVAETVDEQSSFELEITVTFDPNNESYCSMSIGKLNDGKDFEVKSEHSRFE